MPDMDSGDVKAVTAFVSEVIDETVGKSRKKWALLVLALAAGAIGAFWLTSRASSAESPTTPVEGNTS
jgi:hypothetical protein